MSELKKQTSLRWTSKKEFTPSGNVVAIRWTTQIDNLSLTITNWLGTKLIDWSIEIPAKNWRIGRSETRSEYTVSTLKDFVFHKAEKFRAVGNDQKSI